MKLSVQQILQLRGALLAFDGLEKPVEINGKTVLIKKPFKFSGKTRLKIARNLRAGEQVFEDYDAARVGLVRELSQGGESVPDEKLAEFRQRHAELLREEAEALLAPLTEEELNLDENEIPHAALAAVLGHLVDAPIASNIS